MSFTPISKSLIVASALALSAFFSPVMADDQEDADALFAAQEWPQAAGAYEALLSAEPDNANNWFNLGHALHQTEDFAGARDAYRKAIDAGYQPAARARLRLARVLMSLGKEKTALNELEEIAKTGGPSGKYLLTVAEFEPLLENARFLAVVKALTACAADEYRHFDFWLGEWDVTSAGNAQPTAASRISSKQDGCVVLEEYSVGTAFTGMSINFYDSAKETWHQTWMSNAGGSVYLEGALNKDGAMVLSDQELPISKVTGTINRVTWTPNNDGSVRQFWESSTDDGETWAVAFDGLYTKKSEQ